MCVCVCELLIVIVCLDRANCCDSEQVLVAFEQVLTIATAPEMEINNSK